MTDYVGTLDDVVVSPGKWGKSVEDAWAAHREDLELDALPAAPRGVRGWQRTYRRRAIMLDASVGIVAATLAYVARIGVDVLPAYIALNVAAPIIWWLSIALSNGYAVRFLGSGTEEYRSLARASFVLLGSLAIGSYIFKAEVARVYVVIFVAVSLVGSLAARFTLRTRLAMRRAKGQGLQRTIVVGRADSVRDMIRGINGDISTGMRVTGACVSGLDAPWDSQEEIEGVPILGTPERALWAVDATRADAVAISSHPDLVGASLRRLGWALEERQVDLLVEPGIIGVAGPRLSLRPASGTSMLHVERPVASGYSRWIKTIVDRVGSVLLLLAFAPLLLAVAAAIRIESRGPVFFRQTRVGAAGTTFRVWKFRSMVADAEQLKTLLTSDQSDNKIFKMKKDPRITRVGHFIRKYSIDELPQLFNVLRGEMSLIGPRPNLPAEVKEYEWDAMRRLRALPGMTGLWQVSGRSDLSWEDTVRLDLWYVDNWSLSLDAVIVARTFRAVFGGHGAY